jgi:transposase
MRDISKETSIDRRTVSNWIAAGTFSERRPSFRPALRAVHGHERFIQERALAGVRNGSALARELRERGYRGSAAAVRRYLVYLRRMGQLPSYQPPSPLRAAFTARQTSWLLRCEDETLSASEKAYIDKLTEQSDSLRNVRALALEFRALFRSKDTSALFAWIDRARRSEIRSFANGIERDRDAVLAAIVYRWSNGPVEGHVNRLKLVKRQGYGRMGFQLLRERVRRSA